MIRQQKQTEELLLSIPKNCETTNNQTHSKPQETLEFKLTNPRGIHQFQPPIPMERSWMIGLTGLEVDNYFFNTTEEKIVSNFIQTLLMDFYLKI